MASVLIVTLDGLPVTAGILGEINLGHNTVLKQRCLSAGEIERQNGMPGGTERLEFLYRSILNLSS